MLELCSNFKCDWSTLEKSWFYKHSSMLDDQVHLIIKCAWSWCNSIKLKYAWKSSCSMLHTRHLGRCLESYLKSSALDKGQFYRIKFFNLPLSITLESSALQSSVLHKGRFYRTRYKFKTYPDRKQQTPPVSIPIIRANRIPMFFN